MQPIVSRLIFPTVGIAWILHVHKLTMENVYLQSRPQSHLVSIKDVHYRFSGVHVVLGCEYAYRDNGSLANTLSKQCRGNVYWIRSVYIYIYIYIYGT